MIMTSVTDIKLALKQSLAVISGNSSNGDAGGGKKSGHQPNRTLAGFRQGSTGKASIQFVTTPSHQQSSEARIGHHHCGKFLILSVAAPSVGGSDRHAK
jgi:hypothetical protein